MSEINIGKKIILVPGLRYENNRTDYTGPYRCYCHRISTKITDDHIDTIHRKMLSSAHDPFEIGKPTNWLNIRIAYTHTLSKAAIINFSPRLDILNEAVILNNANLEPEFSKNLDIYTSFIPSKLGLITCRFIFKRIDNMIFLWIEGLFWNLSNTIYLVKQKVESYLAQRIMVSRLL